MYLPLVLRQKCKTYDVVAQWTCKDIIYYLGVLFDSGKIKSKKVKPFNVKIAELMSQAG